jgi:uncharacterized protein YxjI
MVYQVRQKIFSLGDRYAVKDASGADRFLVRSAVVSVSKRMWILDMEGRELYGMRRRLLSLLPSYRISRDGAEVALLRQKLSFWGKRFSVEGERGSFLVKGRPLDYDYSIERGGTEVASVSKRFFSLSDAYGVEVAEGEDDAFVLALVAIIDQLCHEGPKGG